MELEPDTSNAFLRFSTLLPVERMAALDVVVIGAGGIGAPACIALAKTGVHRLTIYDGDKVSDVNMGTQMYGPAQIGQPKARVLAATLDRLAPWTTVVAKARHFHDGDDIGTPDVVISAVDSLQARRMIWRNVYDKCRLFIDPRMGAEVLQMRAVEPAIDAEWYSLTLEGEAMQAPCTARATFYTGMVAGAMVAQAVKAWVMGEVIWPEYSLDLRNVCLVQQTREQLIAGLRRRAA